MENNSLAIKMPDFKGDRLTQILLFLVVLFAILFFLSSSLLVYIAPNEFGIKQVKIGATRGIHKETLECGLHFVIPGMSTIHKFPKEIQVFDLSNSQFERSASQRYTEKAAHIQTSDGFFVDVDVSILYRIVDPYKVITTLGAGALYETNGLVPRAEPALKQALGTLTTEEFYNSPLRVKKVILAKQILQAQVEEKGLRIDDVLLRYFRYSPEIQKNIDTKKLKDQMVFKEQAEKHAATEEANKKKIIQQGEAQVAIKLQEGKSYITTKQAEQELYYRKKRAEGDLQVKLAEAYRTELKNKALEGNGSNRMVGLKMAEVLEGLQFIMLSSDGTSGFNPLDLNRMMKLFDINDSSKNQGQ
ncbi:MAG: SPFH domain-containing protein [Proteobacteria bacterium]|nr:SPFH domain-containing protein [Pseudomonadota bacterium]